MLPNEKCSFGKRRRSRRSHEFKVRSLIVSLLAIVFMVRGHSSLVAERGPLTVGVIAPPRLSAFAADAGPCSSRAAWPLSKSRLHGSNVSRVLLMCRSLVSAERIGPIRVRLEQ